MFPREKKLHFFSLSNHSLQSPPPIYPSLAEENHDDSPNIESLQKSKPNPKNSILFTPKIFQLSNKIYKDQKISLFSYDFLPKLNLTLKLLKKIQSNLSHNKTKTAYLYGNQFKFIKNSINHLEPVYKLNEISYATDESFEE